VYRGPYSNGTGELVSSKSPKYQRSQRKKKVDVGRSILTTVSWEKAGRRASGLTKQELGGASEPITGTGSQRSIRAEVPRRLKSLRDMRKRDNQEGIRKDRSPPKIITSSENGEHAMKGKSKTTSSRRRGCGEIRPGLMDVPVSNGKAEGESRSVRMAIKRVLQKKD